MAIVSALKGGAYVKTVMLIALLFGSFPLLAAESPDWVAKSNAHAQVLLEVMARYSPEGAVRIGLEGYDAEIFDLKPRVFERSQKDTQKAVAELQSRLKAETNPAVRQDLDILIGAGEDHVRSGEIGNRMMLPYYSITRMVFSELHSLLGGTFPVERKAKALDRLRRYAGMENGYTPVADLARDRTQERFRSKTLVGPFRDEVEKDLSDTSQLVAGIRLLFVDSGLTGYEEALVVLEKQLLAYDDWIKSELLPRARPSNRMPYEVYVDSLRRFGVDISPEELKDRALVSFAETRNEMQVLSQQIAVQRKFKSNDYRDVIRELKKKQMYGKDILPMYKRRLADIEKIIERENIVSVPGRAVVVRLASEAESAMWPSPYLQTPRLIDNTGEYGEFVLPFNVQAAAGTNDARSDDFTHESGSWSLTVHEARPGHELQFSAMVEKGVSTARAVFATNSVNLEGWALYAESDIKAYLPLDGQLFSLQYRLQCAARAFLDPMVNLGEMTPAQAQAFLMKEVVLSEALAKEDVDRYTFRLPGQATAYFYGYQRMVQTRERAAVALLDRFDRKSFNDFVLAQGALPPHLLQKAVMESYVRSR